MKQPDLEASERSRSKTAAPRESELKDSAYRLLDLLKRYVQAVYRIWSATLGGMYSWTRSLVLGLRLEQRVFLGGALLALLVAAAPGFLGAIPGWIVYRTELVSGGLGWVSSHWKVAFTLGPIVALICGLVAFPGRRIVFLGQHAAIGLLLVLGFFLPGTIHTDIQSPGDYSLSAWVYIYTGLWVVVLATGWRNLVEAPYSWTGIRNALLAERDLAAKSGLRRD